MNSSPESEREERLVNAAVGLSGKTRAHFLDRECAGHPELRRRVEAQLAARDRAATLLNEPEPVGVLRDDPALQAPTPEKSGERIGRYKLLEKVGEGGFGVVWMAEQEEPVRRRVALKIIKLGMDTREVVARFEAERQALALMDHPAIARVFDGGATAAGRPFFVMELVRGSPITEFCERHRFTIRQRLELFVLVCEAVQHAHQKGIIHRDLKPSNILVAEIDGRPHPKIIDFGVAKATATQLTDKTVFTRFQQIIGTPAYMSPEQAGANRDDVDTRSDIYALGVLLYELLTGRTPFDTKKLLQEGYEAVYRTIREQEPPKLSTRLSTLNQEEISEVAARRQATPERLNRLLRGELDWVVMKALEKERARRYPTAADFAGDLQRHLRSEPVAAAPPSVVYRARRFVVRNRFAVGFVALVTALLLTVTGLAVRSALVEGRQKRELGVQRDFATNQAALAREANEKSQQTLATLSETLSQLELQNVNQLLEPASGAQADVGLALAHLARSIRQNPGDFRATYRLLSLLMHRDYGRPEKARVLPGGLLDLAWTDRGLVVARRLTNAAGNDSGPVVFFSFESGQRVLEPTFEGLPPATVAFTPSGNLFSMIRRTPRTPRSQILMCQVNDGRPVGPAISVEGTSPQVLMDDAEVRVAVRTLPGLAQAGMARHRIEVFELLTSRALGPPWEFSQQFVPMVRFSDDGSRLVLPSMGFNMPGLSHDFERGVSEELKARTGPWVTLSRVRDADRQAYSGTDTYTPPSLFNPSQFIVPTRADQGRAIFSRDLRRLAVAHSDSGTVEVWNLVPSRARSLPLLAGGTASVDFETTGPQLDRLQRRVMLRRNGQVQVWDVRKGTMISSVPVLDRSVETAHLSPDGETILTIGFRNLRLLSATDGQAVAGPSLNENSEIGTAVGGSFAPDGKGILLWNATGGGRRWDLKTRAVTGRFGPNGTNEASIRVSPDGHRVATWGGDFAVRVWDLESGTVLGEAMKHADELTGVEFTSDGNAMVTGSRDGSTRVWEAATGKPRSQVLQHGGAVERLLVMGNGSRILTAGGERSGKLWDLPTGRMLRTLNLEGSTTRNLCASEDGSVWGIIGYEPRIFDPVTGLPLSERMRLIEGGEVGSIGERGGFLVSSGVGTLGEVLALPVVTNRAPAWLPELAEAVAGRRLTAQGVAERVPFDEMSATLGRLRSLTGDDAYSNWARWFLAEGPTRPLSPAVEVTAAEFIRQAARSRIPAIMESALELDPENLTLLEPLARSLTLGLLTQSLEAGDAVPTARLAQRESDTQRAMTVVQYLLKLAPTNEPAWKLKTIIHTTLSQTNAVADALARITSTPEEAADWVLRAAALELTGRLDAADAAYRGAVAAASRGPGDDTQFSPADAHKARIAFLLRRGRVETAVQERLSELGISARPANTDPRLLDLGLHFTGSPSRPFSGGFRTQIPGDDLLEVPTGVHSFAGVPFDFRGIVARPVSGITVGRTAAKLHFLQGATSLWLGPTNTRSVGMVVVRYSDNQRQEIEVVGGRHVRDWFFLPEEPAGVDEATVAWVGTSERSRAQGMRLRLFMRTWENPRPDVEISRLDLEMPGFGDGLFLLGITADDNQLPAAPSLDPGTLAEIAEQTGRPADGLSQVEAGLREHPDDRRLLFLQARLLHALKRTPEALEISTKLTTPRGAADAAGTEEQKSVHRERAKWLRELGREPEALGEHLASLGIPWRESQTPPQLLDLSPFYNAALTGSWHPGRASNDLATLPAGLQTFGGVPFDVRGIVQLRGGGLGIGSFPGERTNLVVRRTVRRIHALHATGWSAPPGAIIASLRLHHASGRTEVFPILFGADVRDWNAGSELVTELSRGRVVWSGVNGAGFNVRLFLGSWNSALPDDEVVSLDYVSGTSESAPFLIGLTVEP